MEELSLGDAMMCDTFPFKQCHLFIFFTGNCNTIDLFVENITINIRLFWTILIKRSFFEWPYSNYRSRVSWVSIIVNISELKKLFHNRQKVKITNCPNKLVPINQKLRIISEQFGKKSAEFKKRPFGIE